MDRQRHAAIAVTIAAVVIFIASFMPWGEIRVSMPFDLFDPFGGSSVLARLNAWDSSLNIGPSIPNWILVVVAAASAVLAWLLVTGTFPTSVGLLIVLGLYAVIHTAAMMLTLLSNDGSLGIGILITLVASIFLLISTARMRGADEA